MKITFLLTGKTSFPFVKDGMEMYEKRLSHYITYERLELPAGNLKGSLPKEEMKEKEADMILKKIRPEDEVILLDEKGSRHTSREWAGILEKKMTTGSRHLVFVTGGAYGFSGRVYERADAMLSLSDMTFSHQIIRLFFTEQLYRAMTIIRGEPYHND